VGLVGVSPYGAQGRARLRGDSRVGRVALAIARTREKGRARLRGDSRVGRIALAIARTREKGRTR